MKINFLFDISKIIFERNHHQRKEAILIPSTEQDKIDLILSASVHLVSISINRQGMANPHTKSYSGVMGSFCRVDWSKHKNDPSSCEFQISL